MPKVSKETSPKTGAIKFRVQYKTGKGKNSSRRFNTRPEANAFVSELDKGIPKAQVHEARGLTLGYALKRYRRYMAKNKWTQNACARLMGYDIAKVQLLELTERHAYKHIMFREANKVSEASIAREFTLMKSVLQLCDKWYGLEYPWSKLKVANKIVARDRLITDEEESALAKAVDLDIDDATTLISTGRECAVAGFMFACTTGMRLGEIEGLTFGMLDMRNHVMNLPAGLCKGKYARQAVITSTAQKILAKTAHRAGDANQRVFNLSDGSMGTIFRRVCKDVFGKVVEGDDHFTFHDSRHLAITRMVRDGMPVPALAKTIGHKNLDQLMTYYDETGENIAREFRRTQALTQSARDAGRMLVESGLTREELIEQLNAL